MGFRAWQLTLTHAFEVCVALGWSIVGVSWLLNPRLTATHSPLGSPLHLWYWGWAIGYLVACAAILYGIYVKNVAVRGFGLSILGTALLANGVAAAYIGWPDIRAVIYFVYAIFCFLKVLMLKRIFVDRYSYEI